MPSRRCGGFETLQYAASLHAAFKSKTADCHARDIRAAFWVEENFSQAFFCHCLGRGKFQAKLFFAMVSGNVTGVGDVGGAPCPPPLVWGLWQAAGGDRAPASDAGEG